MAETRRLDLPAGGARPDRAAGSIFFVGTATVVLRYAGFTILTDPNFLHKGDHVHLGYGLTSRRLTDPALELDALPPIDLVVLSHLHEDHFDRVVEERLDKGLPIVTTPRAASGLARKGFRATHALPTWEALEVAKGEARLRITAMPARHGPPVVAGLLPQTMGSLLEFPAPGGASAFRLYLSGDTLVYDEFKEIPRRYPDIDLGLFHLGGTKLLGLVLVTMDPRQGLEAIRVIAPRTAIPIHYDDYAIFKAPLVESPRDASSEAGRGRGFEATTFDDFARMAAEAAPKTRVHILRRGDTYTFEVPEGRWR